MIQWRAFSSHLSHVSPISTCSCCCSSIITAHTLYSLRCTTYRSLRSHEHFVRCDCRQHSSPLSHTAIPGGRCEIHTVTWGEEYFLDVAQREKIEVQIEEVLKFTPLIWSDNNANWSVKWSSSIALEWRNTGLLIVLQILNQTFVKNLVLGGLFFV